MTSWHVFFNDLSREAYSCGILIAAEGRCSPADAAGAQHPVRALLERVQAGRGCAAWEQGNKETHVIALQRATNSPENMNKFHTLNH
uniref:Uncharacterized protein n=1 Tax=Xiphophorus couchianus TaxID=32473 RepID=A0A3B5M8W0_9TELE